MNMALNMVLRVASTHLEKLAAFRMRHLIKMFDFGGTFGVISAYSGKSKKQNKDLHGMLLGDLSRMGYRKVYPLKGSWEGVAEKSVIVRNIRFADLLTLGKKYGQDSVIYKGPDNVIGMYFQKNNTVIVAAKPDGEAAVQLANDPTLYSKARGWSFEFGFLWSKPLAWNGRSPVTDSAVNEAIAA